MKRTKTIFFLFCFLTTSMVVPMIFVSSHSNSELLKISLIQAEDNSTMITGGGVTSFGYWGPSTYYFSGGDPMRDHCFETLFGATFLTEDILDGYIPLLATGYDIVETWPSEMNSLGWNNTGGIRVLDVYLRENVKFHDGSEWNATVAKWNYDRWITLVGNLTGTQVWTQWKSLMFRPARDMHNLYTNSWNFSNYYGNDPLYGTPVTPQYYGKDNDPNLSWTSVNKTYQVEGWYPVINKTLIVQNATETSSGTGGTIRFEFNDWTTGLNFISLLYIMSMETYAPYTNYQIFDQYDGAGMFFGGGPLVGTGQYKYVGLDTIDTLRATLERFDDHWNFTGMRDAGLLNVKDAIIQYYTGAQSPQAMTTAILSGDIDFSLDGPYGRLYPEQLAASTSVDYIATDPADSTEQIVFKWDNTDKALRTAIGYAFNYSKFIAVGKDGRGVISDTPFGVNSYWRNSSIVGPSHDLSIARQTLLDDPFYGSLLAAEGITAGSTTQDWQDFADDITAESLNSTYLQAFTLNYWSDAYDDYFSDIFETSIYDIGMVFNSSGEWTLTGADSVFDKLLAGHTRVWGAVEPYYSQLEAFFIDWPMPRLDSGGYLQAYLSTVSWYWDPVMWLDISENFNYGDINNQTLAQLIRSLVVQDATTQQNTYNDIAELIYKENPHIYLAQDDTGYAVSRKYSIDWAWNAFRFGYVGIGPGIPEAGIELPPDTILITVIVIGVVVVLAIAVYIVMRRRSS